ncbi:PIG-L deacetylase family protein [Chloroflexota bacterium]
MMTREPAQVLLVAPHPDDPDFGAAGSVALWTREGKRVVYVICTSGDKGAKDPDTDTAALARIREKEQRCAAEVVRVKEVFFLRYPDQGLEDTTEFRKQIVRYIRMLKPETVVTCDPYRRYIWHRDHRITGQVTLDAIFPYARDVLAYPDLIKEGLEPHKVKEVLLWATEDPNYRVDITDVFELKKAALHCHKSQIAGMPRNVEEILISRAKLMAEGEKFELGEAFHRVEIPW